MKRKELQNFQCTVPKNIILSTPKTSIDKHLVQRITKNQITRTPKTMAWLHCIYLEHSFLLLDI